MFSESYMEKRPLKKPKLGPADVYPQEIKQKEDELTSMNVKHGFATMPQLSEEFGTARTFAVTASKVGAYFNAILAKKEELMTLADSGRKKQHVKDNFWPVTQRTKQTLDNWFKDLAGNKALSSLAKKAPSFNKKEEIFAMLCENQVTMQRAAWFIKLSSAYTTAVSEAKIKKRQMPDPATEWTGTMIKFLKDLIPKLMEYYHTGPPLEKISSSSNPTNNAPLNSSSSGSTLTVPPPLASPAGSTSFIPVPATPQEEQKLALKQWTYCTQLCKYMFEEGLLDKHEFLNWILDLLDKLRTQHTEDGILKLYLPLALSYMQDFVQSERLSRKLAYLVAKKLSAMIHEMMNHMSLDSNLKTDHQNNEKSQENNTKILSPYEKALEEYLSCPQHRDTIIQLSCILQVVTLDCPTALIWSGVGENRTSVLSGSPLDHLPVAPSTLPMPEKSPKSNAEYRLKLKVAESNIKHRSQQAESRWCSDKWRTITGKSTVKLLTILDTLDSYFFDRMDVNNSLDTLYAKIFPPLPEPTKDGNSDGKDKMDFDVNSDEDTVKILCEWAVSTHRWGEHRAMAVGRLLDKRQTEVLMNENENNNVEDKDSDFGANGTPIYQGILLRFLDNAPVLEENGSAQNKAQFKNLIHLFSELIRNDVFSHDAYMCTLISRGDLLNGAPPNLNTNISGKNIMSNAGGGDDDFFSEIDFKPPKMEEFDDSNVDDDLEKLIQNIKDGQNNSMDAPDSPKDHENLTNLPITNEKNSLNSSAATCRHYLYTMHFPLSQDDASQHDCNQRYILLYGVGKERDERKHSVKKMSKEICKLFSKKFSIDVAEGGKVKKHSRSEFNFESTLNKCQSMCYFDQHFVTWQCAVTVQEMLNSFAMGNSNYLPVAEHVAFLFDLMEVALNIYGVIDMCIQILKELPDVEAQLMAKNSNLIKSYTTTLSLYVVGILRRYNSCLLLSPEQTTAVFEGLCKVVKHVSNPSDCSSAERCILAYLYELYLACSILKTKPPSEPFHNAYPKIKQTIYAPIKLTPITQPYNLQFMSDILINPKRGGKIESSWGRQLSESAMNRYSFVCNAIISITRETENDKLNDIAIMCAELTACCNSLSAEWLGALGALCNTKNESGYYMEVLNAVDLTNVHMYNSVAVFACILVARHCFALVDFVAIVALPALLIYYRSETIMNEVEASARLTCHILLRLFQAIEYPQAGMYSVSTSPIQVIGPMHSNIKLSCDRLLLGGAHKNISVAPVLAVLKAILVVADATVHKTSYGSGKKSGLNTPVHPGSTPKSMSGPVDLSHILGTREDMGMLGDGDDPMLDLGIDLDFMSVRSIQIRSRNSSNNMNSNENAPSLSEFAQHVLKQICTQEWVLECCLKNCDEMCKDEILLDNMLTNKQAQRLLHMICYDQETNTKIEANMDQKAQIVRILENLEQWSLRISLLDLQLMYKQTQSNSSEFSSWLDTVARAAIDVFIPNEERRLIGKKQPIWLVAPLVAKLPCEVQGRILKVAGQVLESTNSFGTKNKTSESAENSASSGRKRSIQIDHQPFLGLVLTCLKGQDDQKEGLLQSLHSQLSQFLQNKELEFVGGIDDPTGREEMLNALQLRFSLVGGMFDSIQKNSTSTTDWALLLAQIMSQGIIDLNNNSDLLHTALDMLATLIHSTLVSDQSGQSERDENKKLYNNLIKKLRKELAEKHSPTIKLVRQLLPHAKAACTNSCEVIACEPVGSLLDTKGLRITEKERVSMWDLLEGHKNPAPLLWSWFGAVKMERKPLTYEESHRLLKFHTHSLVKPSSYFYEPLQLPPEDAEEPSQDKNREEKADTPSSVESPAGAPGSKSRKGTKRPRKPKANALPTPANVNQIANQMPNQVPNQGMNPMMNQQMMNQQMGQQFNQNQSQQQMGNMGMMQNNMMMNQMGMDIGQNMGQNQMQMNQMGMNQMQQNNPSMGQMNPMQYQQQQQQQQQQQMNISQQNMNPQNMNMMGQQNQQWGYQQQQQQQQPQGSQGNQQFYNQTAVGSGIPPAAPQLNQFVERPQLNQSKQALSNMLRQRHPNQNPQFIQQQRMQMMQQTQNRQQLQQIQQRQMMYRARMGGKPMNAAGMMNQQAGNAAVINPMVQQNPGNMMQGGQQGMMAGVNQNQGMMNQQNSNTMGMAQQNPNVMQAAQQPQQTILPGPSSGGLMSQNPVPNMMQTVQQPQASQLIGNSMNQQQNMMQQNVGNQMGNIPAQLAQGSGGNQNQQGNMFTNQYQNINQNYSSYNNPSMGTNQANIQGQGQGAMMGFQQNTPVAGNQQRNPQADFLAQQRRNQYLQQQQQQQQQQQPQVQQTPNVTMNTNMAVGNVQGNVPPPYRQGGKPMVNQNSQQFQQELRMRQMMQMKQQQQQQQGMVQQTNNPNMSQGMVQNQSGLQQQTPALVAQLQRQLPNQMNTNMMNQQQNQQQNFNQGPF